MAGWCSLKRFQRRLIYFVKMSLSWRVLRSRYSHPPCSMMISSRPRNSSWLFKRRWVVSLSVNSGLSVCAVVSIQRRHCYLRILMCESLSSQCEIVARLPRHGGIPLTPRVSFRTTTSRSWWLSEGRVLPSYISASCLTHKKSLRVSSRARNHERANGSSLSP